jgi:hypothetical protein
VFSLGQRAAHIAAPHPALLSALITAGADVNLKSDWQNGPYTVLDRADGDSARFLLAHGATLTPNVAARLGWFDELRAMLQADPALVHARGGDGQQPLHEAQTTAIADLLLNHGADIDARCIDRRSTPAQYALVERPDVCRRLLERGGTPDIFMAARLGDVALAGRLLDADPACAGARINEPGYPPVPPFGIYCWSLGFGLSPHAVAATFGHHDVHDLLMARSPLRIRFINALLAANASEAESVMAGDPALVQSLSTTDHGHLAQTIFHGRFDAADLMLRVGFDPAASTAAAPFTPPAGLVTPGWWNAFSRSAAYRWTRVTPRTAARRSDGPPSGRSIVARKTRTTWASSIGSWQPARTSRLSATGRVVRSWTWRRATPERRTRCAGMAPGDRGCEACGPQHGAGSEPHPRSDGERPAGLGIAPRQLVNARPAESNIQLQQVRRPDGRVPDLPRVSPGGLTRVGRMSLLAGRAHLEQYVLNEWTTFADVGTYRVQMTLDVVLQAAGGEHLQPATTHTFEVSVLPRCLVDRNIRAGLLN